MTKLSNKRIRFMCRHAVDDADETTAQLAETYEISQRRVQQVVKEYKDTGKIPVLDPRRRPNGPSLTIEERLATDQVWREKRVGARLLYKELKRRGYKIPHNKVNKYLLETGRTIPNPNKQKKRKRCRYEREHSFSLVHGDWHRTTENDPYAIVWLDDASRLALCGTEVSSPTIQDSIETFKAAQRVAEEHNAIIREVNTDRDSKFYSNHPESTSVFQDYLIQQSIDYIPSRRNNPQTNGKLERFWYEYDKHRWRFESLQSFLSWYNDRLHGALWLEIAETPNEAVVRKLQPASLLGWFMGWSG